MRARLLARVVSRRAKGRGVLDARLRGDDDFLSAGAARHENPIGYATTGGFSRWRSDSVKISTPLAVTPTECSNCADSERSRVTAVQPSDRIFTCGLPRLIIGSMVKNMPGLSTTPSPGRPT